MLKAGVIGTGFKGSMKTATGLDCLIGSQHG